MFDCENSVQFVMYSAYDAYYNNLITGAEYNEAVEDALTVLGDDAHCNDTDPIMYSAYSDCYKSEYNFRPRSHVTRANVISYLEYYSSPERQAAMKAEEEAENKWIEEQERRLAEAEVYAIEQANEQYEREMWELEQKV